MSGDPKHRCAVCFKCYGRREHLRRHIESHTTGRPYRCDLCHSSFQRPDVLKRHLQTCDGKLSPTATRRRACDRCVRQKKGCNSQQPCENCMKKDVPCQYSFGENFEGGMATSHEPRQANAESSLPDDTSFTPSLATADMINFDDDYFEDLSLCLFNTCSDSDDFDYGSTHWKDFLIMNDGHVPSKPSVSDLGYRECFDFLEKFTSTTGLTSSFDCGTSHQREQVVSKFFQVADAQQQTSRNLLLPFLPGSLHRTPTQPISTMDKFSTVGTLQGISPVRYFTETDPLHWRTHEIILLTKEVVTVRPRNSAVTLAWSSVLEKMCLEFFSPQNLRKFLELYWSIWHPNVNFIHRPTFDPKTCKAILLASMALIGACVSPDPADAENAKTWFNCIEEMIFTDADFSSDYLSTFDQKSFNPAVNRAKTQVLQAAYNVCLYQNWEGTDTSKRRIRRYRFSTVISAARDIGISTARHQNYDRPRNEFDWNDFVAREELIRTFLWILLLDTAFVIFNNLPARMVIKEATMHLACPEACFQAATAHECLDQIHHWILTGSSVSRLPFRSAIESLCRESITQDNRRAFAYLGPLNLFALTSALHILIFQYQNSFGGEDQLFLIRNALDNWRNIWQIYSEQFSASPPHAMVTDEDMTVENMGNRIGFMRHASEFWLLASLMMDRISAVNPQHYGTLANVGRKDARPGITGPPEPILHEYDQTSMQQVNDLITTFQKVQIQ